MTEVGKVQNILLLLGSILLCNLIGGLGSVFTQTGAGSWYQTTLVKPWFVPPGIVFPIAWTALFILMGIALWYLIRTRDEPEGRTALLLFGTQLILNLLWSYLFFGLQSPLFALVEILALIGVLIALVTISFRVQKTAGYLLIPYLAWVCFATVLNAAIVMLN